MNLQDEIKSTIRVVPDFPIPGVSFKDITPLFLNPDLMTRCQTELSMPWISKGITKVLGIESRGFLFGPGIAMNLNAGFVIVRKKGKLPPETQSVTYSLEYGTASIEIVKDSVMPGDNVLIHDDLLATGGTAAAAAKLVEMLGAKVAGFSFLSHLSFLDGENALKPFSGNIHYLIQY